MTDVGDYKTKISLNAFLEPADGKKKTVNILILYQHVALSVM